MNPTTNPAATPTRVLDLDRVEWMKWLNIAIKVALFASFFIALVFPPDVIEGKGIPYRAPLFLAPAVIVPLLAKFRNWEPYPHTADALLSLPFLVDTLGNLLGFYDKWPTTDDVLHLVNWVFLVAAYHAFRFRNVFDSRNAIFLGYGFGAIAIVWWEIMEFIVSEDGFDVAGNLKLTYEDTVGDLFLSSTGGLIGSWLAVMWLGPKIRERIRGAKVSS